MTAAQRKLHAALLLEAALVLRLTSFWPHPMGDETPHLSTFFSVWSVVLVALGLMRLIDGISDAPRAWLSLMELPEMPPAWFMDFGSLSVAGAGLALWLLFPITIC